MADEKRLSTPLEGDILAFGNISQFHFNFSQSQDIGRRAHGADKLGDNRFGGISSGHGTGSDDEIRESLSLRGTALGINFIVECGSATVVGEVRDLNIGVSIAHLARTC